MAMSDGGKGSTPRPFNITQEEYEKRWDHIFSRDLKNEKLHEEVLQAADEIKKENEAREQALEKLSKISQELGLYDDIENPLVKK
jgi:hypothetical protein